MNKFSVLSIAFASMLLVAGCTLNITNVLPDASDSDGGGGTTSTSSETMSTTSTTTVTTTSTTSTTTTDTSSGGAGGEGGAGGSEPSCTREVTQGIYTVGSALQSPDVARVEFAVSMTASDCGPVQLHRVAMVLADVDDDITSYIGPGLGPTEWLWSSEMQGMLATTIVGPVEPILYPFTDGISEHLGLKFVFDPADLWIEAGATLDFTLVLTLSSHDLAGREFRLWVSDLNPAYDGVIYHWIATDFNLLFTVAP